MVLSWFNTQKIETSHVQCALILSKEIATDEMLEGRKARRNDLGKAHSAQFDGNKPCRYIHLSSVEQDNFY